MSDITRLFCFDCGSKKFIEQNKEQKFQYGNGENQVILSAVVPVFTCQDCGYEFCDERAEVIQVLTVDAYLTSKLK